MTLLSRMKWLSLGLSLGASWILFSPLEASAWELFRSENPDVRDGNERLLAGDAAGAVTSYDRAVRALPNEPAVHLDRGLALLHAARFDEAREELLRATEPPASAEVRAAAHYDLGIAFYRQGDAASAENHEEAQRLFREAADAFRNSLRQVPGNRDAAWNLELSLRRIREQEEQQEQQEQERQEQEQQEQENQNQQDQESQEGQDGEQNEQDQEGQEGQEQNEQEQSSDETGENSEQSDSSQEQDSEGEPGDSSSEQDSPESTQESQGSEEQEPNAEGGADRSVPADMSRVLDALEAGEENLERALARSRGQRQARRVIRDW